MDALVALWLPILLSTAAVWVAAAVAWTALPHHNADFKKLPGEDSVRDAMKAAGVQPGTYMFPSFESHKDGCTPEGRARWERAPAGVMTVFGKVSMGRNMGLSFLTYLAVSVMIAYLLGTAGIRDTSSFFSTFQVTATAGILAYGFAFIPSMIWFGGSFRAFLMCFIDGIAYGLITGAIFAGMWPGPAAI